MCYDKDVKVVKIVSIGERMRILRKELKLNQSEFADKIGLKQAAIGLYENNQRGVADRTILLICEKYGVREEWLRTGEGEMFIESDSTIVSQLSDEYGLDAFEKAMISGFIKMGVEQRAMLKEWVKSAMCEVFDDEQAYKEFREKYDKGHALPYAARGGDVSGIAEAAALYDSAPPSDDESGDGNDGM